jgi:hypothetical protein
VAGRRSSSNGFCYQLRQLTFDETHPAHLDGKAKTIYAATQTATNQTAGPFGIIDSNLNIIRFIMKKCHFLLAMLFATVLSISGCKKEPPINIILYDKPLTTIKSYIQGKWNLVYGKGGICSTCVFPCNNCTVEFTTDDRFISKSFVVTTDTTKITWIKDVGMYLQGDSTYLMTFYAYPFFRDAYVIDKIYFDTLIYHDNASDPMFYYCVKSK